MAITAHSLSPHSLTALTEAATAINSTLELDKVLSTIAQLASAVTRAEASSVFCLDVRRGQLHAVAATGHWRDAMVGRSFAAHAGIPGHVVRTGEPMMLVDARSSAKFCPKIDELSSTRTRSLMAVPMLHRNEVVGVIEVVNRRDELDFHDSDLALLNIFATLAASAAQNARAHQDLKEEVAGLRDYVVRRDSLIGDSPVWRSALDLCDRVARSSTTVLLLGETGTGKELAARYVHNASRRRNETFVAVNCAALPETLLESELFGHEKGSFTGAHAQRRGWFEVATNGTLLLDEIGEITRPMQAKLLRVLQEKRIVRVGGTQPIPCDTRIITATNRNLKNMMIDGLFREDLFYRLSVFPIELPPLRERREDIPLFVDRFVATAAKECNIPLRQVSKAAMDILCNYDWPGNIRELQNVIERSVLMSDGDTLLPVHLPEDIAAVGQSEEAGVDPSTLHGQERALILRALEEHDWNQSRAAVSLGISRYHLRHRIKKYNLQKPSDGNSSPS